ncbi:Putative negative regulator of RcsB-dependent stress response [Marinobacter daqiaonensis]|uniref:Ancillary SecYEG translocon subunit n=1 Tax=Marinobacter daqiaonensis TaxID=650891 RepID=A0A1I6GLK1_9GAMM|nr:tetratricopeptide repeat protein [Marinobacter daqiaonensis]SFR43058.1 Putative negative regulator of RcsB-dependent stress response [Marinobacter daqiaonensis]
MAEMRTEEEQIEAIKNWWKKNGSSLLIGIALALAIVFGWQAWQNHQAQQRAEAASAFNQLLDAAGAASTEEDRDTVAYLANQVRENHEDSAYAVYAMMLLANQQMMTDNDPEAAAETLGWALEQTEAGTALSLVVRTRLARAQYGAGQYDDALSTVRGASDPSDFEAILAELEGDILLADGDRAAAEEAYLKARNAAGNGGLGLLELKLDDLGIGGDA